MKPFAPESGHVWEKVQRKGKNPDKSKGNAAYCGGMYIDKSRKSFYNFLIASEDLHKNVCAGYNPVVWPKGRIHTTGRWDSMATRKSTRAVSAQAKKAVKEAAEEVKAVAKKAPVKKPAARKAAEPSAAVHFQYNGRDIAAKEVLAAAMEDFKKNHPDEEIKEFELYIVAEENAAYYVVNGIPSDDYKIVL